MIALIICLNRLLSQDLKLLYITKKWHTKFYGFMWKILQLSKTTYRQNYPKDGKRVKKNLKIKTFDLHKTVNKKSLHKQVYN